MQGLELLKNFIPTLPPITPVQPQFVHQIKETINLSNNGHYQMQYNKVYISRFAKMGSRFSGLSPIPISSIVNNATISGVLKKRYKKLERKIGSKKSAMALETEEYIEPFILYGENDLVELEDKSGKIEVQIDQTTVFHYDSESMALTNTGHNAQHIPFGVFIGIKGYLNKTTAKFICQHIFFPKIKYELSAEFSNLNLNHREEYYVYLVSDLTDATYKYLIDRLHLENQHQFDKNVLVLCGNLLDSPLKQTQKYEKIDSYLSQLINLINVIVLPDCGAQWPEDPLPKFFLKNSSPQVLRANNPTFIKIQNFEMVLTNGENITSSLRACNIANTLDIMESHIIYNHIAPYSPSLLVTKPLEDDAFVLNSIPSLYAVTKQGNFSSRMLKRNGNFTRLLTIPSSQDGFVRVNSKTLQATLIYPQTE